MNSTTKAVEPSPGLLWVGGGSDAELDLAKSWARQMTRLVEAADVASACATVPEFTDSSPAAVLLASPTPFAWSVRDCIAIARRWPLAPIVSVSTSLLDGRRRSGPQLPGIEEVSWNELPGRLAWWLHDRSRGRPGGLGMPATARREERLLEAAARVAEFASRPGCSVTAAASRAIDLEGLTDLLAAAGRPPVRRICGRPAVDEPADIVVWDVGSASADDLTWLRMAAANRPGLAVILLESFPRGEWAAAALAAGATAVLARPASLESLTGLFVRLDAARAA
jgi:CheY-like chemotaxis protein